MSLNNQQSPAASNGGVSHYNQNQNLVKSNSQQSLANVYANYATSSTELESRKTMNYPERLRSHNAEVAPMYSVG